MKPLLGNIRGEKFSILLLKWNSRQNTRTMPWKGEKDPYKIWLSEIILQQTRVEQGWQYYLNFITEFPNVKELASAPQEKVFKLWEGLGYYSRCRNLIASAKYIYEEKGGKFPDTYSEILHLKGVGPYTAAAIASFAYNLPYAVVDGNVFRVLARVFGIDKPIDDASGKKYFSSLAEMLLDKKQPALYNQAIMDFGAVVCKPAAPLCTECVFQKKCVALATNKIAQLPVKAKKTTIKKRWFYFLVIRHNKEVLIHKRTAKDIWQGLYDFPLIELADEETDKKVIRQLTKEYGLAAKEYKLLYTSDTVSQQLSHRLIHGVFFIIEASKKNTSEGYIWVKVEDVKRYPFPRLVLQWLAKEGEAKLQ